MLERRHMQLKDFIRDKQGEDFCIPEMTEQSVKKALASLQINKSTGSDNISARLLKAAAPVIAAAITAIMNNSIRTGRFPSSWKLAKVSPLHKKGPISDKGNYGPISVLCALSKILQRHVHDSIGKYLVSHNMLYGSQSGFRAQHSCETAISYMVPSGHRSVIGASLMASSCSTCGRPSTL